MRHDGRDNAACAHTQRREEHAAEGGREDASSHEQEGEPWGGVRPIGRQRFQARRDVPQPEGGARWSQIGHGADEQA